MWRKTASHLVEDPLLVKFCTLLARPSPRCLQSGAIRQQGQIISRRKSSMPVIIKPTLYGDPLHNYNNTLASNLDHGKLDRIFKVCRDMLDAKINPDQTTYNIVLQTFGRLGMTEHAEALIQEMKTYGIEPNAESYTALVRAYAMGRDISKSLEILEEMKDMGLAPLPLTYQRIIEGVVALEEFEWGLDLKERFQSDGVQMTQLTYISLIKAAVWAEEADVAMQLLREASSGLRPLPASVHLDVLRVCAYQYKAEHTKTCWDLVTKIHQSIPDEGLCIDVLMCAGVSGQPDLARDVLRMLARKHVQYADYHLAPLLQAFAVQDNFLGALNVIVTMRNCGITPTVNLAYPLVRAASESVKQLDNAWSTLETVKEAKKPIDPVAIEVMLRASQKLQDLDKAMMIYETSIAWGIEPTLAFYKTLLSLCVDLRASLMGDRLLKEMTQRGIAYDEDIYTSAIALSLTETEYENAFKYLEELKAEDIVPSESIYRLLVKKCARERDSRAYLAMEEMEMLGYTVTQELRRYVESAGEESDMPSLLRQERARIDVETKFAARRQIQMSAEKRLEWMARENLISSYDKSQVDDSEAENLAEHSIDPMDIEPRVQDMAAPDESSKEPVDEIETFEEGGPSDQRQQAHMV